MKIQLPLDNWADLLPLVPRHQLVEIVKQLGDRQFAKILQFFLTKVGQITLGHLRIVAPREDDPNSGGGPIVEMYKKTPSSFHLPELETNLPEGPMPTNVKDFKQIQLSYFDESVGNFLRQFQQEQQPGNSLLDNVNLWFLSSLSPHDDDDDDNTISMQILAQLVSMIGNINSMFIYHLNHMGFGHIGLGSNNAASKLLTTMLTNARILEIHFDMHMSIFPWCDWLYAPRNDGKPRALRLHDSFPYTKNLIEEIKKDFSKATRPASFFVYVRTVGRGNVDWQDICLDNGQTNERLVVKTIDPHPGSPRIFVLISRYPVGANQEWIESNEQEIMKWNFHEQNRRIHFETNLRNGNGGNV